MRRRGSALLAALLAIVCMAALLSAIALTGREDQLAATALRDAHRAFTAAERAAWTAVAAVDSSDITRPLGSARLLQLESSATDTVESSITRIAPRLFFVIGEGGVRGAGGGYVWRRVAILVRAQGDSADGYRFVPLPGRSWAELR